MKKRLLLLAGSVIVFNLVLWGLPKLAPESPGRYEGVSVAAPPSVEPSSPSTPLPDGFPSMEYPPPKIEVPAGEPQPIATKFGLTYDIPADWRNFSTGITGWTTGENTVTYGAVGDYGYKHCPESDGSTLAESGMTGRTGIDIPTAAFEASRQAEIIFGDFEGGGQLVLSYSDPIWFEIGREPAVRYTVRAENIKQKFECDPSTATFDVVATTGFATAPVAVFMVLLNQDLDGALEHSVADELISSIRRTDLALEATE